MPGLIFEWRGDAVADHVTRAAVEGTVETVDAAVEVARANAKVLSGAARDSLRREDSGLVVRWGYHVRYGIYIEIGARGLPGDHNLRSAGDAEYPRLASRIAGHLL